MSSIADHLTGVVSRAFEAAGLPAELGLDRKSVV